MIGSVILFVILALMALGASTWKPTFPVHRVTWIEGIGDRVRRITVGKYTVTFSPKYGSNWIPAPCLFIESEPNRKTQVLRDSWDLIIATRKTSR